MTANSLLNILIVDDHKLVRDGIKTMLESKEDDYTFIITEAASGMEAIDIIQKTNIDVVLMDQQMPELSGAETVQKIRKINPSLKILAISNYDEIAYINDMLKSGASGYVLKNIDPNELIKAIETILSGKNYYANDIANKLINVNNLNQNNSKTDKRDSISKREMEILKLIASEYNNEQISEKLKIAKRTVDSHRQNLLNKLGVKNTAGLINYAYRNNLI